LTFARVGITDPRSLDDYLAHDGYRGLEAALALTPAQIVERVTASGLRGRGGAAFPAGIKWKTVLGAPGGQKYVVCNADEGDSGTFSDRMVMEGDPFVLIEGMTIAGLATGADRGYIYLRWEYPDARRALEAAIQAAYQAGYLGGTSTAAADASISKCAWARAPISAGKRPRSSSPSRASAGKCASSPRCRRLPACSASRPSSTT
jgi:formate dehydrogenase iron-sulfur subunit